MSLMNKIKDKWENSSVAQKSILAVMAFCFLLSSCLFYRWATTEDYAPLFVNMQSGDAGEVVEKLKSMNIPYQLADTGRTIMVPQDQVYELRLSLAGEGVFSEAGSGFELFDSSSLGVTDFERHLNYQRALQEELRRTIIQLDAVEQARVHLVLPEQSVFIENEVNSSASIVLKLKPMAKLQPEQVKGVADFVANSVEKLDPDDVNIIDTEGTVLNQDFTDSGYNQLRITLQEMKRDFENNLEKRIKDLLEKIWGSGKIVAMVTADLDFNQREVTRIIWGDEGVIASEQVIQRKDTTSLEEPFAVGQENREDLLYQEMLEDDEVLSAYIETIRNYEIDRTEEKEFYAPGRLLSLSTAVAVNGDLSIEQEEEIIEIVSAAIGFNTDRGDQINVISMDFDDSHLAEVEAEMERLAAEEKRKEQIENWISWGEKGLIILLAFILGIMLIRTLRKFLTDDVPDVQQPTPVREIEEQLEQVAQEKPDQKKEEKVKEIVEQEPEVAAQIINTWLEENEDGSGN